MLRRVKSGSKDTDLEGEILIRLHKADALEMICHIPCALLFSIRRERRAAATLAFSIVDSKS